MKLRNVITKEIWNIPEWRTPAVQEGDICFFAELNGEGKLFSYKSLDDLNKEWEDYTPAEPLIKDVKIRKAVRAWAEAESEDCYYGQDATTLYNGSGDHIEFWSRPFKDLTPYEHYTIAELCGEEEE